MHASFQPFLAILKINIRIIALAFQYVSVDRCPIYMERCAFRSVIIENHNNNYYGETMVLPASRISVYHIMIIVISHNFGPWKNDGYQCLKLKQL